MFINKDAEEITQEDIERAIEEYGPSVIFEAPFNLRQDKQFLETLSEKYPRVKELLSKYNLS